MKVSHKTVLSLLTVLQSFTCNVPEQNSQSDPFFLKLRRLSVMESLSVIFITAYACKYSCVNVLDNALARPKTWICVNLAQEYVTLHEACIVWFTVKYCTLVLYTESQKTCAVYAES